MQRDIIDDLIGHAYHTLHDMQMHVILVDPKSDQRYRFKYDQWSLDHQVAIEMARAELARMWRGYV